MREQNRTTRVNPAVVGRESLPKLTGHMRGNQQDLQEKGEEERASEQRSRRREKTGEMVLHKVFYLASVDG